MRSMWLSADITPRDVSRLLCADEHPRVHASVVPLARERKNPECVWHGQTGQRLTRWPTRGQRAFVAGGPNPGEPFGLFFAEIRNIVAFRLLLQHFAARTRSDRDVPTARESHESRQASHRSLATHRRRGPAAGV